MSKILKAVLIAGVAFSSAAQAKKEKIEPVPECPVDTVIRSASSQTLKNFSVLSGCKDQVVVAEATPEEFLPEETASDDSEQASFSSDRWADQYAIDRITAPKPSDANPAFALHRKDSSLSGIAVEAPQATERANPRYSIHYLSKGRNNIPYAGTGAVISIGPASQDFNTSDITAVPVNSALDFAARTAIYNEAAPAAAGSLSGNAILSMRPQSYRTQFDTIIADSAVRHRVDPLFLHAVIKQESGYRATIGSHAGARGLMQIMPATGRSLGVEPNNLTNASINVDAGTRLLRKLYFKYNGNFELVLAAYNAGEGAVQKYGNRIPPYRETQNYVKSVMAIYYKLLAEQNALASAK